MKEIQFENKKLYSVVEVGKILGIGKARVYKLIKDGRLPAMNLGGLKIRKEALDNFLDGFKRSNGHNISNLRTKQPIQCKVKAIGDNIRWLLS